MHKRSGIRVREHSGKHFRDSEYVWTTRVECAARDLSYRQSSLRGRWLKESHSLSSDSQRQCERRKLSACKYSLSQLLVSLIRSRFKATRIVADPKSIPSASWKRCEHRAQSTEHRSTERVHEDGTRAGAARELERTYSAARGSWRRCRSGSC